MRLAMATALIWSASFPGLASAEDDPLPQSIAVYRDMLKKFREGGEDARWTLGRECYAFLMELEKEKDPRVVGCLLDTMEAERFGGGHHGEMDSRWLALKIARTRRNDLSRFIEECGGRGRQARGTVANLIGDWKAVEGIGFLKQCLRPGDKEPLFTAIEALGALPGKESAALLREELLDARESVFSEYPLAFQRWDRLPKAVPYKYSVLHPLWIVLRPDCIQIMNITDIGASNPLMRNQAGAYALRQIEARGEEVSPELLKSMVESGVLRLQLAAARHIGGYLPRQARDILGKEWKSPYFRGQCAEILALAGDERALQTLAVLSRSEDLLLRVWAVQALAETRTELARGLLDAASREDQTFVAQAAVGAMRARGIPISAEALAKGYLSWDHYLCREVEWVCDELPAESRARVALLVLAGEPAAAPDGPNPVDPVTAGGEAEPRWDGEGLRGTSATVSSPGSHEGAEDRILRFWRLTEGLDPSQFRAASRKLLEAIPLGPEAPLAEGETWNDPRQALAFAALAVAPEEKDLARILSLLDSPHPPLCMAAIRGLGTLGGPRAEEAILRTFDKWNESHDGWDRDGLYWACIVALAECGGEAGKERWLSFAPWKKKPEDLQLNRIDGLADLNSFVDGAIRSRSGDRRETMILTRDWLLSQAGYHVDYDTAPRFWRSAWRRDPAMATGWAIELLEGDSEGVLRHAMRLPVTADSPLVRAAAAFIVRNGRPHLLRDLHKRNPAEAVRLARAWLGEGQAFDRDPGRGALYFILEFGDESDLPLLERIQGTAPELSEDLRGALRRFLASKRP